MKYIVLLAALTFSFISTQAHAQKSKKWDKAIASIEKSDFVDSFKARKDRIEDIISRYKAEISDLGHDEDDINTFRKPYQETKQEFDQILDNLKESFTNKNVRNDLKEDPDTALAKYKDDLNSAYQKYVDKIEQPFDALLYESKGAGLPISEISLIIGLFSEFQKMISNSIKNTKKMSAQYFEDNLLYKLRLKEWDEY